MPAFSKILSGCVNKEHIIQESGVVIDGKTGTPVAGALVSIPSAGTKAITNDYGIFKLDVPTKKPVILSVQADGYKPFSLVIKDENISDPLKIAIEEKTKNELVIDTRLHHLGDNKYSNRSANAFEFNAPAAGPYYFKEFFVDNTTSLNNIVLKIGSIIGIDTKIAQSLRQSGVHSSSSSPVKVFLNSQKIGEISFNGDNHLLQIPSGLLRVNSYNNIRIETGINLNAESRTDYDDIEFIHLLLEFR